MAVVSEEVNQALTNQDQVEMVRATIKNNEAIRKQKDRIKHKWFIVDPRKANWVIWWDLTSAFALLYVAVVTPFEVAYLGAAKSAADPLFLANQLINFIFIADCVLNFCLMVEIPVDKDAEPQWTSDPKLIACNYLKTWFAVDATCIAVSGFDYISIFGSPGNGVESLRILRILRTLRLMKLVKLVNGMRLLRRYELKVAMNYAALSLFQCVVGTMLLSHWFACVWGLQVSYQPPTGPAQMPSSIAAPRHRGHDAHVPSTGGARWSPFNGRGTAFHSHHQRRRRPPAWPPPRSYCLLLGLTAYSHSQRPVPFTCPVPSAAHSVRLPRGDARFDRPPAVSAQATFQSSRLDTWMGTDTSYCYADPGSTDADGATCASPVTLWMAACYFAVMTITSIGYGDISAVAGNTVEQGVATILMLLGSMAWGCVLGTIVSNLSNLDPERDAFTATMSELNRMMVREGLPQRMRIRLREYFHSTAHIRQAEARTNLLQLMSPTLRSDVAWEVNKDWLQGVWFLNGSSTEFMVRLSMSLRPCVFAPGEVAPMGPLYIVNRGLALYGGVVYSRGRYWGEDMLLSPHLQKKYLALAMGFLEVFSLARDELLECASHFPETAKLLRHRAIRLACRRGIVAFATKAIIQTGLAAMSSKYPILRHRAEMVKVTGGEFKALPMPLPMPGVKRGDGDTVSALGNAAVAASAPSNSFELSVQRTLQTWGLSQREQKDKPASAALDKSFASLSGEMRTLLEGVLAGQSKMKDDLKVSAPAHFPSPSLPLPFPPLASHSLASPHPC